MARASQGRGRRQRGSIERLPSGALRVAVYAGTDPVTKRRHYLREIIPPGPRADAEAAKALRRLANQVDERRHPRTNATLNQLLDRHFAMLDLEPSTVEAYRDLAAVHIRPLIGSHKVAVLDGDVFDSLYTELRRCRLHCDGRPFLEHRTDRPHECDSRCGPHMCRPLSATSVRKIHFILSGALKRAVRWRWIASNPIAQAAPPAQPKANPRPPTAEEAARILDEAWRDPEWGLLVWLAMVTGFRRGEICGLRWRDVDLGGRVIRLERSVGQRGGRTWEKDTKTHQHRRIALDPETVALLAAHKQHCVTRAAAVDVELNDDAFVFSTAVDGSAYMKPDSITQRYNRLAERLGLKTTIHKLRHYSATELIAAGVDIRTVAGRLGHTGGGSTTLRVYAAWLSESDQRAAGALFNRMPPRRESAPSAMQVPELEPRSPYERIAADIRDMIQSGAIPPREPIPTVDALASTYGVARSTAQRAIALLKSWGLVAAARGWRARVVSPGGPTASVIRKYLEQPATSFGGDVGSAERTPTVRKLWMVTVRGPGGHRYPPRHVVESIDHLESFRAHFLAITRLEVSTTGARFNDSISDFELEVRDPGQDHNDQPEFILRWHTAAGHPDLFEYWVLTLRGPDGTRYPSRVASAHMDNPDSFRGHLVGMARIECPNESDVGESWIGNFELEVRKLGKDGEEPTLTLRWQDP